MAITSESIVAMPHTCTIQFGGTHSSIIHFGQSLATRNNRNGISLIRASESVHRFLLNTSCTHNTSNHPPSSTDTENLGSVIQIGRYLVGPKE